ncbi:MAG: response regulator [Longimicrobiales bacterium]|nr:response regulator [Longimicrobiales bacterium]
MARILIVDDEEMDRVLERTILENAGHDLLFASDGEHALKLCREGSVELVVTDLAMPDFNGLRFIKELREDGMYLPLIAVSGWAVDQLDLAREYGADITLAKPVSGPELLAAVETGLHLPSLPDRMDPWRRVRK